MSLLFKYNYGNLKPKFQIKKKQTNDIYHVYWPKIIFPDIGWSEYYSSNSFVLGEKKSTSKQVLLDGSKD